MLMCEAESRMFFSRQAFPLAFQLRLTAGGRLLLAHDPMFLKALWRQNKISSKASSAESISGLNTFNPGMTLMKPRLLFYQGQRLLPFPREFYGRV